VIFLAAVHLAAAAAVVHACMAGLRGATAGLAAAWFVLCGLSITGGYHRLFAHRSYRAALPLRLFYLLFGAASFQNSALRWSADHRTHHRYTDRDEDPYDARRGFWWSHIGWVFYRTPEPDFQNVADLRADFWVRLQDRAYLPIGLLVGFALPTLIAASWGDPWGGLLLAGFLRLALQYQATFSINSLAHRVGRRPYSTRTSARDSALAAVITLGEGYHNFHHRFPADYRNGVRFFHFDPTKWWLWTMSRLGLARDLRRTPPEAILQALRSVQQAAARQFPRGQSSVRNGEAGSPSLL
jgi:stearoyl-CoA desaturase (delta-9 desaturase)